MSPRFTKIELLAVMAALGGLMFVVLPALAGSGRASRQFMCRENLAAIGRAMIGYAGDQEDSLPDPGWDSLADGAYNDSWCYGGRNQGRLTNNIPNITGTAGLVDFSRQEPFRKIGELWSYLRRVSAYYCPEDPVLTRPYSAPAMQREMKLTSFTANGSMLNLGRLRRPARLSRFRPIDFAFWEPFELDAFNFSDSACLPSVGVTGRHGPQPSTRRATPTWLPTLAGGHVLGFDGRATWMSQREYYSESGFGDPSTVPQPNRAYCYRP